MALFQNFKNNILSQKKVYTRGVSLIEVMIGVTIFLVLILIALQGFTGYLSKSRDGRRKSDLDSIKTAFEDYYNDNGCYPQDTTILENCNGNQLKPHLAAIPCDPMNQQPYLYLPEADCKGFRVLTKLEYDSDPIIGKLNCLGGCGIPAGHPLEEESDEYVFGVSEGVPVSTTGTGDPSIDGKWVCTAGGDCNECNLAEGTCTLPVYDTYGACLAAGCESAFAQD